MNHPLVIGVAGGTGSGKTTVVERLLGGAHADSISLLPHDAYYRSAGELPRTADGGHNWDHPDALDTPLFIEHVSRLRAGLPVSRPVYDFITHSRSAKQIDVPPRPVILLEGILLFAIAEVRDLIDLRVYVDTPADVRIVRRMRRDITERGRSAESVARQYEATVRPMHQRHVEPSRDFAHIL
ncbi:MAG: uridine kinase, partial [Fimbriiglobus sp.]|nr:uridine kinase [Fimbriiglobus sp.]